MNQKTYHFAGLRLNDSPQTRISSQAHTTGFTTLDACTKFCDSIGFGYSVYYYDEFSVKTEVHLV